MEEKIPSIAVHGGEHEDHPLRAVVAPIFQTSIFSFQNFDQFRRYALGELDLYFYSRYANPTADVAARKIAELEGAEAGLVTASGSAATLTVLLTLVSSGDEIISTESIYGGTLKIFKMLESKFGVVTKFVDGARIEDAHQLVTPRTKVFWFETPANPINRLVDIEKVAAFARSNYLTSIADNTFATPVNQRPILAGADVVVHSATKALGGHSDLTAGAVCGSREFIERAARVLRTIGATLEAQIASLLIRGIKTLDVRVQRINENAQRLAEALRIHPKIARVYYPGLDDFPGHELARQQMKGFGGIVAADLKSGLESDVEKIFDAFRLVKIATSLGGVETLATYPVYSTHFGCSEEELARAGISRGTVRFSVGIENADEIIGDVLSALERI